MAFIQVPPDSTGKQVETFTPGSTHRQGIVITGDGATGEVAGLAQISPVETEWALITRPIQRVDGETLSTTPLGISGSFTQAWQDANADGMTIVEASARADVASATNGFRIEETDDDADANFTRIVAQTTVSASTLTQLGPVVVTSRKWRVVYVNGGTAQASFRLTATARSSFGAKLDSQGRQIAVSPTAGDFRVQMDSGTLTNPLPAGTNNIGDVDVLSLPALPAGTNNIGDVDVLTLPAIPAGGNKIGAVDLDSDATIAAAVPAVAQLVAGTDGTNARALKLDAAGEAQVDILTLPAIPAGGNKIGAVDLDSDAVVGSAAPTTAQLVAGSDGTNARAFKVDAAGEAQVDVLSLPAIPAGTNNIGDVDVLSLPAIPAGTNNIGDVDVASMPTGAIAAQVQGTVAHDAAAANNPVPAAARANLNEPTAVADGDVTHLWADLLGRLVVIPGHPNPEPPVAVNATASGETTVIAAPGASLSLYICKASVHNRATTNRVVALKDGAAGTVRWRAELAAEGGGSLIDFGARGWKLTANTLLSANLDAAGDVDINITEYYIAA